MSRRERTAEAVEVGKLRNRLHAIVRHGLHGLAGLALIVVASCIAYADYNWQMVSGYNKAAAEAEAVMIGSTDEVVDDSMQKDGGDGGRIVDQAATVPVILEKTEQVDLWFFMLTSIRDGGFFMFARSMIIALAFVALVRGYIHHVRHSPPH